MDILVMRLGGRFAHFRKVYSNSSSLSYYVPPRTTVCGIIAAILGLERDSYYERFSLEKMQVAVKIETPLRKMIHTVNYMFIKGLSDFTKRKQGTQVPYEIVAGAEDEIAYTVYIGMEERDTFDELVCLVKNGRSRYIPSLGAASFLCHMEYGGVHATERVLSKNRVPIHTVTPLEIIASGSINVAKTNKLVKENMPFSLGSDRLPREMRGYVFDFVGNPLEFTPEDGYYPVDGRNIVFM